MVMLKMNRILEIDVENLTATCEPGVIIADLNAGRGRTRPDVSA